MAFAEALRRHISLVLYRAAPTGSGTPGGATHLRSRGGRDLLRRSGKSRAVRPAGGSGSRCPHPAGSRGPRATWRRTCSCVSTPARRSGPGHSRGVGPVRGTAPAGGSRAGFLRARGLDCLRTPRPVPTPLMRRMPNLNELFVPHEDARPANGGQPRSHDPGDERRLAGERRRRSLAPDPSVARDRAGHTQRGHRSVAEGTSRGARRRAQR